MKSSLLNSFGPLFYGNFISAISFGVLITQAGLYYHRFSDDSKWMKLMVALLCASSGFQLMCITDTIWYLSTHDIHSPPPLKKVTWGVLTYQVFTTMSSVMVQTFLLNRIWTLCGNVYITGPLEFLIWAQLCFGMALSMTTDLPLDLEMAKIFKYHWLLGSWLSVRAICDAVIAASMIALLLYRRAGYKQTNNAVNTIVYWIICSGTVTCILSIIAVVSFAQQGFQHSALMIGISLGGLYPISMLANLHIRSGVREKTEQLRMHKLYDGETSTRAPSNDAPTPGEGEAAVAYEQGDPVHNRQKSRIVVTVHRTLDRDNTDTNEVRIDRDSPNAGPSSKQSPEHIGSGHHDV